MFDRCYCIISPKCSVTLAKNVALYFVNVWITWSAYGGKACFFSWEVEYIVLWTDLFIWTYSVEQTS